MTNDEKCVDVFIQIKLPSTYILLLFSYLQWNKADFDTLQDHPGCFGTFDNTTCPAPFIGVALDGFPIYGPQKCDTCETYEEDGTTCATFSNTTDTYV